MRLHSEPQFGHMRSLDVRPQRGHIYGLYESFVIPNSFPNGLSGSIINPTVLSNSLIS